MTHCTSKELALHARHDHETVLRTPFISTVKYLLAVMASQILLNVGLAVAQVMIDVSKTHQLMDGFGTSSRVWDDPHLSNFPRTVIPRSAQTEILTLLYRDLGLTQVRPVLEAGIEPTNDNGDPFTFDWRKFNFEGKRNDAHVEFVKQSISFGLRIYFPAPVVLEKWMHERNPEEYVEWALAILLRWRALGLELPFYSVINEPGYRRSGIWSGRWLLKVVSSLGPRMRAAGLKTMLVIPDDLNATEAYKRTRDILVDPDARPYVGALAYHLYGGSDSDLARMRDLSLRYNIPLWMSEYSDSRYNTFSGAMHWVRTIHNLIANYRVSAVNYMFGFFGSWEDQGAHSLLNIDFDRGVYQRYKLTPVYYLTGQYSRFVRPGHVRVEVRSGDPHILVTAYRGRKELVIVAVNPGREPKQVRFTVAGGEFPPSLLPVQTSHGERWKKLGPITPKDSSFTTPLPAESVTTLVGTYR